jgi:hypothetical protein
MKMRLLTSRLWLDFTGLVMPPLAIAAYVLGWSPVVRTALMILCFAGIYGTWLVTTDLRRWHAHRIARFRMLLRR